MKQQVLLFFSLLTIIGCTISPESGQYAVESDKFNGEITVHEGPGMVDMFNVFDAVKYYDKENMYSFSHFSNEGTSADESIYVKFADFGEANISGTVRYAIPTSDSIMQILHERYEDQDGIEKELIRQAIERAVYLSGPLMTSQESNSSQRAYLLDVIMDQAQNGVYRVKSEDIKVMDVATNKEKTIKVSRPIDCDTGNNCINGYVRTEPSPLNEYNIRLYNFTIKRIEYSGPVKDQIAKQQEMNMQMEELSIKAKKSQTEAITTVENAKAEVALVNAEKDKQVAQAQANTAVAREKLEQAKLDAAAQLVLKKAEAEGNRLKVQAGLTPLEKARIDKETAIGVAAELAKRPVPMIVNNGSGNNLENAYSTKEMLLLLDQIKKNK